MKDSPVISLERTPILPPIGTQGFLEIEFYLTKRSEVQLDFYDVSDKLVASHTGSYRSGMHVERIESKGLPSGVYFLRAKLGRNVMIRKFMVIR